MIILAICIIIAFVVICLVVNNKSDLKNNIIIDKNSILFRDICNEIKPELFKFQLDHMVSKDLFKLSAKEELFDLFKLKINNDEYKSYYVLSTNVLKGKVEDLIYENKDIDLLIGKIFDDQIEKNISECEYITNEHLEFINQFDENSKSDLELHPKESNIDESETEEIEEISLDKIISTGTTEDYFD